MDLGEAVKLMFQKKIKKLPLIERERLVGFLSLTTVAARVSGIACPKA